MKSNFLEQRKAFRSAITKRYEVDKALYDAETRIVAPLAMPFSLRKGEYLQSTDAPARVLHWITEGVARIGFSNEAGVDVTLRFAMAGYLATTHDLLTSAANIPALHYVIAETAVEGFAIDWEAACKVRAENPMAKEYHAKVLEYRVKQQALRSYASAATSARDRLSIFRAEYPGLESKISQKVIASYLGITPQYLSQLLHRDAAMAM